MDEDEGEVTLATNAPATWPIVRAPPHRAEDDGDAYVATVSSRIRDTLRRAGYAVDASRRAVQLGMQSVRVDLVVDMNGVEVPVFVFTGDDPHREAIMYGFLRAALSEARAFAADPVYYAPDVLPTPSHPSAEDLLRLAARFANRTPRPEAAFDLPPASVVGVLRAHAGRAVEAGGGEAVQEGAAFVGEWLRRRAEGTWLLREDLPRSVLAVRNAPGTLQYYLPLFAWFPDAVRVGYDGLAELLDAVVLEATTDAAEGLAVRPPAYGPELESWLDDALSRGPGQDSAVVLRRCAACGRMARLPAPLPTPASDLGDALRRSLVLAQLAAERCPCGAQDYRGAQVGYLLASAPGEPSIVSLVYSTESHTRIAVSALVPATAEDVLVDGLN